MSINNEKGYVLLLTLIVIVIIGVLISPLIGSTLSSASQAQMSKENSQLVKMNEMGIVYARNTVLESIDVIGDTTTADLKDLCGNEFNIKKLEFENYTGQINGTFIGTKKNEVNDEIDIIFKVEVSLQSEIREELSKVMSFSSSEIDVFTCNGLE